MKLLAIETSTEQCSVALLLDGVEHVREVHAGQKHSDMLLDMAQSVVADHGLALRDLEGLAFGAGPGSFTGLRIACGVVQGLAFGLGRKVVGITSLEALAEQAGATRVIAALDARMNETYLAAYEREPQGWRAVVAPCLCDAGRLPQWQGQGWTAIGSAFDRHDYVREHFAAHLSKTLPDRMPSAREIARLAAQRFAAGLAVEPDHAAPLYIRDKVAMTIDERATLHQKKRTETARS